MTAPASLPRPAPCCCRRWARSPAPAAGGAAPRVSFEFFPPKTDEAEENLWNAIRRLEPLNPAFVSVTYGAGGSTRERTHRTVTRILAETGLKPAAHLTCVEASRGEVDEVIARLLGRRRAPHRGPARRSARRRRDRRRLCAPRRTATPTPPN